MPVLELSPLLTEAACAVLETMFFTEVLGESLGEPQEYWLTAQVEFQGNRCGWLTASAGLAAARQLASNFLCEDETSLAPGQIDEVMAELSNMVCGSALSRIDPSSKFAISHPRLGPHKPPETVPPGWQGACQSLDIGDGVLRICFAIGEPV
ncbi:MAG: chemotaxis protein CheX [Acidobacteria bacterium]|nr:chemotaxis protein CheX [Acidobacteriota bacterium]